MGRGISSWGHEALGAGWLDGDGMMKMDGVPSTPDVQTSDLAQRALAEAFDQLSRVGQAGANCCVRYGHYGPAERVTRETALHFVRAARETLTYAHMLISHLPEELPALTPEELQASKHAQMELQQRLEAAVQWSPPAKDRDVVVSTEPPEKEWPVGDPDPAPFTGGEP